MCSYVVGNRKTKHLNAKGNSTEIFLVEQKSQNGRRKEARGGGRW